MADNHSSLPPNRLSYGVIEATRVTGIGRSTLYAAMAAGRLRAIKLGSRTLIRADELRRFLDALPSARPETICNLEKRPHRNRAAKDIYQYE
jgi:excisionase family DNA binding protein